MGFDFTNTMVLAFRELLPDPRTWRIASVIALSLLPHTNPAEDVRRKDFTLLLQQLLKNRTSVKIAFVREKPDHPLTDA